MPETPTSSSAGLIAFSEQFLERHGRDTPRGVGWTRDDSASRYRAMLQVIRDPGRPVTLLDFGCGLSQLNDLLLREGPPGVTYAGLDLSDRFLAASRQRYPSVTYYKVDVLAEDLNVLPEFDYVVMNGIWHSKASHTDEEMWGYLRALVRRMFTRVRIGLAFNVITKQVEWEREDLFHVPVDPLLDFLSREVSRHVVIRHDYGLFEYTVYVYREPSDPERTEARLLLQVVAPPSA